MALKGPQIKFSHILMHRPNQVLSQIGLPKSVGGQEDGGMHTTLHVANFLERAQVKIGQKID